MKTRVSWRYAATVGMLVSTAVAYALVLQRPADSLASPLESIGTDINGWTAGPRQALSDAISQRLRYTSYLARQFTKDREELGLLVVYYAQQRAGESMHSPKYCLPGAGWEIWQHGSAAIPVRGRDVVVNRYSINKAGHRMVMLYWYQSRSRIVASEFAGKVYTLADSLTDGRTSGSLVRILVRDTPESVDAAVGFASALIPKLERSFGGRVI